MNQKITFATVLVAFFIFFICFTNATPIELSPRVPGAVAFADFSKKVTGRITITELWNTCVRVTGQFNTGFPDRIHKYEYQLSGEEKGLISNDIIFPPGTAPFEKDIQDRTVEYFVGKTLSIFCDVAGTDELVGVCNSLTWNNSASGIFIVSFKNFCHDDFWLILSNPLSLETLKVQQKIINYLYIYCSIELYEIYGISYKFSLETRKNNKYVLIDEMNNKYALIDEIKNTNEGINYNLKLRHITEGAARFAVESLVALSLSLRYCYHIASDSCSDVYSVLCHFNHILNQFSYFFVSFHRSSVMVTHNILDEFCEKKKRMNEKGTLFVIKIIYIFHLNAYKQNFEESSQPDDLFSSNLNNEKLSLSLNVINETDEKTDLIDFEDLNQITKINTTSFLPAFNLLELNDLQMETVQKVMTPMSSYPETEIDQKKKACIKKLSCFEEFDEIRIHDNEYKFLMEVDEKNHRPDWAKSENLSESLRTQQKIDPETIFRKPEGLNIEKIFNKDLIFNFENNYESLEPDIEDDFGDDTLTEGEVKAYNEKMGYKY
ncbi:hypothetical protein Glove_198g17 [Diversispora epigaea]|uniref:Inner centromere protein ARK-binding domain-containing protein n=1 Tax=Diversispora epigaea TaxID=1348612 RepID=A0A397ING4_9GLOM|nr:hypothetical protein Glove_198g17 [Diversispora epigaea]